MKATLGTGGSLLRSNVSWALTQGVIGGIIAGIVFAAFELIASAAMIAPLMCPWFAEANPVWSSQSPTPCFFGGVLGWYMWWARHQAEASA